MKLDLAAYAADIRETVTGPMLAFMEEADGAYAQADVEACQELLMAYLRGLNGLSPVEDAGILAQVETVVKALNALNEATEDALIETGEREALYDVIQRAAEQAGLREVPEDVTEPWREW